LLSFSLPLLKSRSPSTSRVFLPFEMLFSYFPPR
jgi:hypothetical protein